MRHLASRQRWNPENAIPITEDETLGTVYVYPLGQYFGARGFYPKAIRPAFAYRFKNETELDSYIQKWFEGLRAHRKSVIEHRAASNAGHNFKVGDIVTNSWGYDQTNVDWYRVSKATKNYVWLKRVVARLVPDEGCGPMSGQEALALDENLKPIDADPERYPETKHKASGNNVTMRHGCGSKHTGGSEYTSWYA